ncbi:MFS transporter [Bosea sp. 2RAB26]|uniref:MFS transporter n=1 Tax=Bosea sp. 2RAB26 TaxID=3237476 RepID=UPI003F9231AC
MTLRGLRKLMTSLPVGTPGGHAPRQVAKPPPGQQHALLRILGLACFGSSLGVFLFDPVLPLLSRDFAVPRSQVVAMATAFALAYALAQPIAGALGDQLGKLRVMRVCLGVSALGTLLGSLASSFELLLATRLVVGFFTAGTFPLCFAILAERIAPEGHQEAFGKASAASVTGSLAGAVGSGFIADALGWRGSLLVAGPIGLSCFAIVTAALRDTREVSSSRAGFGSAFSAYRRITPVHFTLAGGLVMTLAMASLSAHLPWPLQFGALLAFGFAYRSAAIPLQTYLATLTPHTQGAMMALHSMAAMLGQSAMPLIYAAGFDRAGIMPTLLVSACLLGLCAAAVASIMHSSKRCR